MNSAVKYGQEIGPNLIRIAKKLFDNQNLLMLLVNTDKDPLNKETHPKKIDGYDLLHKNIRVIPLLDTREQNTTTKIILYYADGAISLNNSDNENLSLRIDVYCPFEEWAITGDTLRPFAVMSEIRQSIQDKRINGLGEIQYRGFSLSTLTEEMGCYTMDFYINAFS